MQTKSTYVVMASGNAIANSKNGAEPVFVTRYGKGLYHFSPEYPDAEVFTTLKEAVRVADNIHTLFYGSRVFIHSNFGMQNEEIVERLIDGGLNVIKSEVFGL